MYKKLLCITMLFAMSFFASSAFAASHEQNFITFTNSIIEAANRITWSGKHNLQDSEFVKDDMDGDEMVYDRAWYSDYYIVVRKYSDKTWAKSEVSFFWTSSEELTFAKGIKVGSSVDDIKAFFGEAHVHQRLPSKVFVDWEEESDVGIYIVFSIDNNRVTSIGYRSWDNLTSKMSFLCSLYADLYFAEVTGDKVNVRENIGYGFGKGEVSFQVSKSKRDCLLVHPEEPGDGWCYIGARIVNNVCKHISSNYYISKQFLKIRKLSISERNLYISQFLKR